MKRKSDNWVERKVKKYQKIQYLEESSSSEDEKQGKPSQNEVVPLAKQVLSTACECSFCYKQRNLTL